MVGMAGSYFAPGHNGCSCADADDIRETQKQRANTWHDNSLRTLIWRDSPPLNVTGSGPLTCHFIAVFAGRQKLQQIAMFRGQTRLHPAALAGEAGGFDAVRHAELRDRLRQIISDRALRQTEALRDV